MRVLNVQRFNRTIGGRERYASELRLLLEEHGDQVTDFTLAEPETLSLTQGDLVAPKLDVDSGPLHKKLRAAAYRLYNPQSARVIRGAVRKTCYDVAHIHTLHHVSVSVAKVLSERNIPVVWTLHDYQCICPNNILFTGGALCERCLGHRFYEAAFHRCNQNSLSHSVVSAIDTTWLWLYGMDRLVDTFIAPSNFMRDKVVRFGLPESKVVHVPHFAPVHKWDFHPPVDDGSILYAGRLYRQKGVHVLIDALIKLHLPDRVKVIIVGDGPELGNLRKQASDGGLHNITFTGYQNDAQMQRHLRQCSFSVVPSVWYEVLGFALLESFTIGRPVVASRIGGIPEVVTDNLDGRLVEPDNVDDLAAQLEWMLSHTGRVREMGRAARQTVVDRFSPEQHYRELIQIYNNAITKQTR